jgi:hypothetical protein
MRITKEQIQVHNPCKDGLDWYLKNGSEDLLDTLLRVNTFNSSYARWLFTKLMTIKQNREIAIFSAEQVLHIFEKKYPNDKRPREAIEAAKAVLENDTAENRERARQARAYAAAAAAAAAAYAAYAAAYAAYAAADAAAAYAAAAAAAAAYAAAYAAYAAADAAAYAARKQLQEKIIKKAVEILERDSNSIAS